jgi:hypothetical protein
MEGYNGTVMAYGQTGTGKTFTLGRLGEEDTAARGIMVRAMEDILADITPETDSVSVSYLQVCDGLPFAVLSIDIVSLESFFVVTMHFGMVVTVVHGNDTRPP